jgi:hypothetical protein
MEVVSSSETSLDIWTTRRYIPEDNLLWEPQILIVIVAVLSLYAHATNFCCNQTTYTSWLYCSLSTLRATLYVTLCEGNLKEDEAFVSCFTFPNAYEYRTLRT